MNGTFKFAEAVPVWEKGMSEALNLTLDFITDVKCIPGGKLFVAGSTSFTVWVNGSFVGFGPARTAHGFYKVDEISLEGLLTEEKNVIDIRVCGYNANSFCYLKAKPFLCAEIIADGKVIAATGHDFKAVRFDSKIIKAPRYSYQRAFCEAYNLNNASYAARDFGTGNEVVLEACENKAFLLRDVPYSEYKKLCAEAVFGTGTAHRIQRTVEFAPREITEVGENYDGFCETELEIRPWEEYGSLDFDILSAERSEAEVLNISDGAFADVDMGNNSTGLFDFTVEFKGTGTLLIAFDEIVENGKISWHRGTLNILVINGEKGEYRFTSAEPYVFRYARLTAVDSDITVKNFGIREIAFPESKIGLRLNTEDGTVKSVYAAALRTFRANVLDIYMDCPSRERAGWLCDSFFMGRTEKALTGENTVERAFLNNFLMPDSFDGLPEGMLPMCYPSDCMFGQFIPTWAMWFGLQVYDYYTRTGDRELVQKAKNRLYALLGYFKKFENEFGLLEKLDGWVFVEWSKANDLVQEVSFPSNMVYSALKSAVGVLYNDEALINEGRRLRKTIKEMSLTESGYFCDNAVRRDGKLCLTGERTEVCQYYAFFFKIAEASEFGELWSTMVNEFGFNKSVNDKYGPIYPANAFIGNYLRMELLLLDGKREKLYSDIKDYFTYMAELTGTLWENTDSGASCNHGFASYVIYWLKQLGAVIA